jgi:hypothetical protein
LCNAALNRNDPFIVASPKRQGKHNSLMAFV